MTITIHSTEHPDAQVLSQLGEALSEFNASDVGPSGRRALAVFAYGPDDELAAGLYGYTAWGWLYIQWLWVREAQRGQGLAARLIATAECEASARACHGAWIDTFSPVALRLYQRLGYAVFGTLENFPPGRCRSFLKKPLTNRETETLPTERHSKPQA
ncbi:GNAT family N-acetyltransferase [Xaviernesmea oryzae]|uniref:GNAT family N-acetyltransferase n=1 Tax=Xaviernesmea oryzae TaxID=464029 RepID=A0A1Q9AZR7_9HYPH|nr:GNAT family N-acetyltransferase [Xaviernesmea oryzae]OLP61227.1 GNAT family N-acetyltransferase [Xaviernesmea oryzae]SEL51086.1 Acetyltransferase (GNAT) family protein [Xaviernesmea oryzae]